MTRPIDICYFLGPGSQADDWELRYSMRSWYAHLFALGNFQIVGHLPAWLRTDHIRVRHHPFPDPYRRNKDANLIQKLLWIASDERVSDPFIMCSDDQFLLRAAVPAEFEPHYHVGKISDFPQKRGHSWWERLHATGKALRRRRLTDFHFDAHIPFLVHKEDARTLLRWNFGEGNGFCIFSLLFNGAQVEGTPINTSRIRAGLFGDKTSPATVELKLATNLFASIDADSMKHRELVRAFEVRFPHQAPWEAYAPVSPNDMPILLGDVAAPVSSQSEFTPTYTIT